MRIDLKKFLFLGLKKDQDAFFKKAQSLGIIQFVGSLDPSENLEAAKVLEALQILKSFPSQEISEKSIDPSQVILLKQKWDTCESRLQEMREIEIFGDLLELKTPLIIQFFKGPKGSQGPVYVSSQGDFDYFVSLSDKEETFTHLVEIKVNLAEREPLIREREQLKEQLTALSASRKVLEKEFIALVNQSDLKKNEDLSKEPIEGLFSVIGWVPAHEVNKLEFDLYIEELPLGESDSPPTLLENEGLGKVGEDLIDIYDTPSHQDKDPSYWVLGSFALFFAFIIGDAGYGFLYLLLFAFLKWKYPDQRIVNLGLILSGSCVLWGIGTHSFFGISIPLESYLRSLSLLHYLSIRKIEFIQDKITPELVDVVAGQILLELSLVIGVFHVMLGMIRYLGRNLAHLGWIIFLIGMLFYIPSYLGTVSFLNYVFHLDSSLLADIGLKMIYAGCSLAVFLAIIKHKWHGFLEIMNVIQVFGDVLSYLRLYALVFAGAIMSITLNQTIAQVPWFIGIILAFVGHAINMVLGIMGGVIHGLRLNFLEWYHYSFEGGGKKFKPLKLFKE